MASTYVSCAHHRLLRPALHPTAQERAGAYPPEARQHVEDAPTTATDGYRRGGRPP